MSTDGRQQRQPIFKAEKLLSSASIAATDPDDGDVLKFTMDCNGYNTTYFEMDEDTGNVYFEEILTQTLDTHQFRGAT